MPIDLFGMDAADAARRRSTTCRRTRLHDEMARRRVYLHPIRWTSLGLSLIEAMHLGMPVVALATTEAPEAVPAEAGRASRRASTCCADAVRGSLHDPDARARARAAPRARPRSSATACERFLADWDDLLEEVTAMRIAMVSEHASPLAVLGGVDAGGQNVHVAALARALARRGAEVVVHTRRDDPDLPERVAALRPASTVDHVDAGPAARRSPRTSCCRTWPRSPRELARAGARDRPDVVHAHFWMSGLAALRRRAARSAMPVVQTFHALGVVKRRYQGDADTSPPERLEHRARRSSRRADRIVATCTDEVFELDAARRRPRAGSRSSRAASTSSASGPTGPREPRGARRDRLVCVGRLVERKGIGNVISALAGAARTPSS